MPFSLSNTKARFSRAFDHFKRKISVAEITEAPHPSIDDFLAHRNQDQETDDGNDLPMCQCSTCQQELQPHGGNASNTAAERVDSIMMNTPGPGISQVSLVFVSRDALSGLPSMPAKHSSARRRSSANTSVTTFQFIEERHTSKDTVMASPSALVQAFRDCIPTHQALVDLPDPFSRHSDPTYREGPAKRAEIRRQASQRALQRRCSDLDDEADKLAARLEETEKQLNDARQELESVLDELAAREDVNHDLRHQCSQKEKSITYWKHQHDTLARDLSTLQDQLDHCTEQKLLDRDMIQSLLRCRRHRHCKLRYDVLHLSEQLNAAVSKLQDLKDIRYESDLLQYEMRGVEDKQAENEKLEVPLQESQAQNEVLKGEVQDLWNQRSSDDDIEATQLAEREVFVMHERLRMAERELKLRRTSLEVVRQNNRDLGAEIACLRLRLVDQEKKDVRWTA
ncbi:hypothetical protein M409DRAFT_26723 [Zasmidium cellare ATCC 36951]|uniref:Uncharacterized protein n=1 Tax=Zasmidium cellare ATCC 36951 TaxID=1080233 RepID=A0A6A6C9F1_ZASCE|nr:uncharacterized protein M409DRAFT_26723 [Zasmidium cellare ATCC 36951]KAF2162868.1 hypothetical protein M409DRAFT_26723 [Zasmidium cellare ATCC 36951]